MPDRDKVLAVVNEWVVKAENDLRNANVNRLLALAGGTVLVLCDEVLNFLSRHRDRAESFRDFLGNLVRTLTGTVGSAALISLPQSKPEMSDWDLRWQDIVVKEVNRVATNLISNDEAEISEVVRRRLFEDLGNERTRKGIAKAHADWCFERRAAASR
jgi:predicted AAA+ superfamily ATPase